jgi:hypothetical protein
LVVRDGVLAHIGRYMGFGACEVLDGGEESGVTI